MQKFLFGAVIAAQAVLLLSGCSEKSESPRAQASSMQPVLGVDKNTLRLSARQVSHGQIETKKIRFGALEKSSEFSSVVEAPSDKIGIVSPQINGIVTRVLVDVGDQVSKGQVLFYISSPDLADAQASYFHAVSKFQECRSQSTLIKTRLELARKDVERYNTLVSEGISARRDFEAAQVREANTNSELLATEAAATAAEAQLNAAKVRLAALGMAEPKTKPTEFTADLPLISPASGVIVQRNISPGQSVGPSSTPNQTNKPFISIANLEKVWVMLEVPQSQVSELRLGDLVKFRSEIVPKKIFEGRVTRLGENVDPVSHCFQVRTEIDNEGGLLKPGTLVIATVNAVHQKSGLLVPKSAIQNIDGTDYLFSQTGTGQFKKIPVTILSSNGPDMLIQGKVGSGDSVVTNGAFFLKTEIVKASMGAGQ
jgi:cobalt-zinc-cadmium efflux system membrane fusion protein